MDVHPWCGWVHSMNAHADYLGRKQQELRLIARALGRSRSPRVRTIEGAIEEKFRLGAELRAKQACQTRDNTETQRKTGAVLRSGPFTFTYRYQRADLAVTGPFPYGARERLLPASAREPIYTSSGMAAISAVLLAVANAWDAEKPAVLHLAGCYNETLEAAAATGFQTVRLGGPEGCGGARGKRSILWLDCLPCGESGDALRDSARAADLVVCDTTALPAQSGRIRQFLRWVRDTGSPIVLVRSHTKLDTLGIEYGRLGSVVFATFPEVPFAKLARWRSLARSVPNMVRLLGNGALPGHFCPYADGPAYWRLSSRRSAAMLRNGRLTAQTLARQLGRSAVRRYGHGAFAALVPPRPCAQRDVVCEAEQLAGALADKELPVRHAGSFGFDFVAVESFFDTTEERHLLRVAAADLPTAVSAQIADGIADWWERRWRRRVA